MSVRHASSTMTAAACSHWAARSGVSRARVMACTKRCTRTRPSPASQWRPAVGLPFAAEGTADSRRAAWAAVGVHLDELSSLTLCLGLPGDARTALGRTLASCREAGQPTVLTLRQLRCHDRPLHAARVRICENPVVVATAADELGARCQPLVCVGGQPSAAGWRLLELLAAGGAEFDNTVTSPGAASGSPMRYVTG